MKKRPEIKIGSKFHWWDRDLWHIVNIFYDGDYEMIVLKSWAKYKNRWVYEVTYREVLDDYFDLQEAKGRYGQEKNSKDVC